MSEQDPLQKPGAKSASLNDAGRAAVEEATKHAAEFLQQART